nr:MAG TPA: hypothetical protein [Caudoviricetes sp.]
MLVEREQHNQKKAQSMNHTPCSAGGVFFLWGLHETHHIVAAFL